jgi:hypothetical protein
VALICICNGLQYFGMDSGIVVTGEAACWFHDQQIYQSAGQAMTQKPAARPHKFLWVTDHRPVLYLPLK